MDRIARTLSERDVVPRGDTAGDTIGTIGSEMGEGAAPISLDIARRAKTNGDLQRWMGSVFPAVEEFLRLRPGWDSYRGVPLKLDTGMFALQLLYGVMNPRVPVPMVAPTSSGGIQFEWYTDCLELEFCVAAPYECELSYRDRVTGEEGSHELSSDFSLLTQMILKLQPAQTLVG